MNDETKLVFAPKILLKFQQEKEFSIINKLIELFKIIIDAKNYKHILNCLLDKFKKQKNVIALDTLLEIEDEFL